MIRRLNIRPEASVDLAHAHAWYTTQRPSLGDEFQRAVGLTFSLITQAPEAMPVAYRDTRRALLRRFPYAVYYSITADLVEVRAVLHTRRNPRRWKSRVRET